MPYGNGQRLGETIDPRLMQVDFSGYERAGATMGNAYANMGRQIGDSLKLYGEEKKQHTQAEQMAKSMAKAIPEFKPMAGEFLETMANPDLSHRDKTAIAASIQDLLKLAVLGRGFANEDRDFDSRERQEANRMGEIAREREDRINAAMNAPLPPPHTEEFGAPGGIQKMVWNGRTGQWEYPQAPSTVAPQTGLGGKLPDPLKPFAKDFETAGARYGVPADLLAAIAMHETGNGTSSAFRNKKNLMGVSNASGPIPMESEAASIEKMARLIGQGIHEGKGPYAGVKSIEELANIYAPVGAGNDPTNLNQHWTGGVKSNLQKLQQDAAAAQGIADASQQRFGFKADPKVKETPTEERIKLFTLAKKLEDSGDIDNANIIKNALIAAGSGSDLLATTKIAEQKEAGEIANKRGLNSILNSSINVLGEIDKTLTSNPMLAKAQGGWAKAFEASKSGQIEKELENIRVQTSKDSIFELKRITNAVGQTTDKEWPKYESRFGDIRVGMNPEQVQNTVKLNALNTFEVVNGSPDKLNQMLKDGKINQGQFNEYVDSYLQVRKELQIPDTGVYGNSLDWSKLDKGLLQQSTSRQLGLEPDVESRYKSWLERNKK